MIDLELARTGLAAWQRGGDDHLLSHPADVGGPDWPEETAIAITFRGEKVVAMQDYASLAEAFDVPNQAGETSSDQPGSYRWERSRHAAGDTRGVAGR